MSLNILIVEDEILIAEMLKLYLEEKNYKVCAICISYEEAVEAFVKHNPELVLLDIRLSGEKSGIDMAKYLNGINDGPPYIYLTSQQDNRILQAALATIPYGYISKPIQRQTLWANIELAFQLFNVHKCLNKKIDIKDGRENHKLFINEILYLQSDHVYTTVFLAEGKSIVVRCTLHYLYKKLKEFGFLRCHRRYIINKDYIRNWNKETVGLNNGVLIPVGKTFKPSVDGNLNEESNLTIM